MVGCARYLLRSLLVEEVRACNLPIQQQRIFYYRRQWVNAACCLHLVPRKRRSAAQLHTYTAVCMYDLSPTSFNTRRVYWHATAENVRTYYVEWSYTTLCKHSRRTSIIIRNSLTSHLRVRVLRALVWYVCSFTSTRRQPLAINSKSTIKKQVRSTAFFYFVMLYSGTWGRSTHTYEYFVGHEDKKKDYFLHWHGWCCANTRLRLWRTHVDRA